MDKPFKKVDMPLIVSGRGRLSYGGHQGWYADRSARAAGCGSVAAANALAVLARHDEAANTALPLTADADGRYERSSFLRYMEGIYSLMGSGFHFQKPVGISISRYVRSVLKYGLKQGIPLTYEALLTPYCSSERAESFLEEAFDRGQAVTLAMSWNSVVAYFDDFHGPAAETLKNHYVTVSGIETAPDGRILLLISTWGRRGMIRLDELTASWQSCRAVDTALIKFSRASSEKETKKALRTARWLVARTLLRIPVNIFAR